MNAIHTYTLRGPSTKECPKTTPGTRYPHRSVLDTALPVLNSVARHESSFKDYWKQNDAEGSYQARRRILSAIFDPFERHVEGLEDAQLQGKLVSPVSPRDSTGWVRIDTEIKELREKFAFANTQSDFSDVGNRAVRILDELLADMKS